MEHATGASGSWVVNWIVPMTEPGVVSSGIAKLLPQPLERQRRTFSGGSTVFEIEIVNNLENDNRYVLVDVILTT